MRKMHEAFLVTCDISHPHIIHVTCDTRTMKYLIQVWRSSVYPYTVYKPSSPHAMEPEKEPWLFERKFFAPDFDQPFFYPDLRY